MTTSSTGNLVCCEEGNPSSVSSGSIIIARADDFATAVIPVVSDRGPPFKLRAHGLDALRLRRTATAAAVSARATSGSSSVFARRIPADRDGAGCACRISWTGIAACSSRASLPECRPRPESRESEGLASAAAGGEHTAIHHLNLPVRSVCRKESDETPRSRGRDHETDCRFFRR
jgi:hypothetical protein